MIIRNEGKNMVKEKIIDIIANQLYIEKDIITLDSHLLTDLRADSLDMIELCEAIEDEFDIEVPDEDFDIWRYVHDIIDYVNKHI